MTEADAARLAAICEPDGHNEPCLICQKPCNSFAGNPALWPLRLGNRGWHHTGCVRVALYEHDAAITAAALTARRQMRLEAVAYHERLFTEIREADLLCGAHMNVHKKASEYFQSLPDEPTEPQKGK